MPRVLEFFDANGNPTVRDSTPAEDANVLTLVQRANTALTNNGTFLALGSPTNAQLIAQAQALTRQTDGLIRFLLSQFGTIADS